ncbi:MAG: transketolase family protein [Candidatus Humimicrobiaceae bacterium]
MVNLTENIETEFIDTTKYFGEFLIELARKDKRVVYVDADSYIGAGVEKYKEQFPERFFEFGVAEQNACGNAAGLAWAGQKPFFATIANFATMRCFEQIRDDIVRPGLNVAIVGRGAGISYSASGPTHNTIDDFGLLRILPGITLVDPADLQDFKNTVFESIKLEGPIYFREHKCLSKKINPVNYKFEFGKGVTLKEGSDTFIISSGTMVYQSMLAAETLEKSGIFAGVINMHTIKPIDEDLINKIINSINKIVTVEEHFVINGLGSAVADILVKKGKTRQLKIGFDDQYNIEGPYEELLDYYGLTGEKIAEKIKKFLFE